MSKGLFVMVDGLDLSGKGTALDALREWAQQRGRSVFDLREYSKRTHNLPQPDEVEGYDVILSAEPTYAWAGRAIRDEIAAKNSRHYSARETAEAFSNDRVVLYKRIIVPMLAMGKIIFQERGNATSFAYQPLQAKLKNETLELEEIMSLAGNKFTLKYPPSLLIITLCEANTAMERKLQRTAKNDNCIFEEANFQSMLKERYESEGFRKIFQDLGTEIRYVNTNSMTIDETKRNIIRIWEEFLHRLQR